MSTRVIGLPECFILKMYISGLKEELQVDVILSKPSTIHEAMEVSNMIDAKKGGHNKTICKPFNTKYTPATPQVTKINSMTGVKATQSVNEGQNVFKRLFPAERTEKKKQGFVFQQ